MDKINAWLKRRSVLTVSVLGLGGVLLLGLIGFYSLPQTRFALFYMLIVAGAALWGGLASGIFLSLASATVMQVVEWHDLKGDIEPWQLGWNLGVRFGIFLFAAWAMAQLRELTRTLAPSTFNFQPVTQSLVISPATGHENISLVRILGKPTTASKAATLTGEDRIAHIAQVSAQ